MLNVYTSVMNAGGTFALYSLLCRYCNISSLPNQHPSDVELTTYLVENANQKTYLQRKLEGSPVLQKVLLLIVLLGTCMVIGDGILTPSISGTRLPEQCKWVSLTSMSMRTNQEFMSLMRLRLVSRKFMYISIFSERFGS